MKVQITDLSVNPLSASEYLNIQTLGFQKLSLESLNIFEI